MASEIVLRAARAGEADALTALCVRSKARWGYDSDFMRLSRPSLTVDAADIVAGRVLVAERDGQPFGMAEVAADGELDKMFVDPSVMGQGVGQTLFNAAVSLARRLGAERMAILADPNAAAFYERMGARFVRHASSDAIPGRTLPLYEYDLTPGAADSPPA